MLQAQPIELYMSCHCNAQGGRFELQERQAGQGLDICTMMNVQGKRICQASQAAKGKGVEHLSKLVAESVVFLWRVRRRPAMGGDLSPDSCSTA